MKKLVLIVVALVWSAGAAFANTNCAQLGEVVQHLGNKYGETLQTMALSKDGKALVNTFANKKTGTWTLVVTDGDGLSCMAASGTDWLLLKNTDPDA